jgi:hypothetical protein
MYDRKRFGVEGLGAGTALVTTATATAAKSYLFLSSMRVNRIAALITTLVANDTVEAKIKAFRRPTPGSDTGAVEIGVMTIPDGEAVGNVIMEDVDTLMNPGEELVFKVTTAGTDSSAAAGAFLGSFEAEDEPQDYRELDNVTLVTA